MNFVRVMGIYPELGQEKIVNQLYESCEHIRGELR